MKIKFKHINSVDLSTAFPVIEKQEYSLLSEMSLIIPNSEYEKIKKNGFLQVGEYQVSGSLIEVVDEEGSDSVKEKIKEKISEKNLYFDDVVDAIYDGVKLEKNVLLFGRGGHNKSEGTLQILDEMQKEGLVNSKPFIMSFGDGLTEEALFGGINIKKFRESGELEYLFKNSFMEHEVVIFEELFDAPPQVLLSLKDILTSGYCRKGNQIHESKTKIVIGLTNKSKEDFSEDESLEALTQRFPLTNKVEWPSYTKKDWRALFDKIFSKETKEQHKFKIAELVEILDMNHLAQKSFCSPRTAVHAAELYISGGNLRLISDIDKDTLENYYKSNKDNEAERRDEEIFKTVDKYIKDSNLAESDILDELLNIVIEEQTKRTKEEYVVSGDMAKSKAEKHKVFSFVASVLSMHSFSAKNMKRATDLIKFYKDEALKNK